MISLVARCLGFGVLLVVGLALPANGGDGAAVGAGNSAFSAAAQQGVVGEQALNSPAAAVNAPEGAEQPAGQWTLEPMCDFLNDGGCVTQIQCADGSNANTWVYVVAGVPSSSYTQCPGDPAPAGQAPVLTVTPAQALEAFRRVPLPESEVMIPAAGETLVNFPTNVYTEAEAFDESVAFFGGRMQVVLHITPTSYLWRHGDGATQTTDWPGRAWRPSDGEEQVGLITHAYESKAEFGVSVDTTWSATWTLNGRDMGAVPGTVTIAGDPKPLDVLEARPALVG